MPELMRFDRTKSMMRYLPPKWTAGFARSLVKGCSRSPRPPARIIARTSIADPPYFQPYAEGQGRVKAEKQKSSHGGLRHRAGGVKRDVPPLRGTRPGAHLYCKKDSYEALDRLASILECQIPRDPST